MKKNYKIFSIVIIIVLSLMLTSCKKGKINMDSNIYAQIVLTTGEKINLELYHDKAPETVENFVKLANSGYYKKTIFHRVIKDFMIQTGGYYIKNDTLLELDETPSIKGEFANNGFTQNNIKHKLGVISMARTNNPNSATSQFFLCSATCDWLDNNYAAFGKTTDNASNQVILRISNVQTQVLDYGFQNFPVEPIVIKNIYVSNKKYN